MTQRHTAKSARCWRERVNSRARLMTATTMIPAAISRMTVRTARLILAVSQALGVRRLKRRVLRLNPDIAVEPGHAREFQLRRAALGLIG